MKEGCKKCAEWVDEETMVYISPSEKVQLTKCQNFQVKGKKYKVIKTYSYETWK